MAEGNFSNGVATSGGVSGTTGYSAGTPASYISGSKSSGSSGGSSGSSSGGPFSTQKSIISNAISKVESIAASKSSGSSGGSSGSTKSTTVTAYTGTKSSSSLAQASNSGNLTVSGTTTGTLTTNGGGTVTYSGGNTSNSAGNTKSTGGSSNKTVHVETMGANNEGYTVYDGDKINPGQGRGYGLGGITAEEYAAYAAEKKAQAIAKGDLEKANYWGTVEADMTASANVTKSLNLRETYNKETGLTYENPLQYDAATNSMYISDTADVLTVTNPTMGGYEITKTKAVGPVTASSTNLISDSLTGSLKVSDTFVSVTPGTEEGFIPRATVNSNNTISIKGSGTSLPLAETGNTGNSVLQSSGDFVDSIFDSYDNLYNQGIGGTVAGLGLTMLLPIDAAKTIKKMTDGRWEDISGWDIAYSVLDVLTLIPPLMPLKALKVTKAVKAVSYGGQAGLLGADIADTVINGDSSETTSYEENFKSEYPYAPFAEDTSDTVTLLQSSPATKLSSTSYDPTTLDTGEKMTDIRTESNTKQTSLSQRLASFTEKPNPSEQDTTGVNQIQSEDRGLSEILSAVLAGAARENSESSGGGSTTVINQAADTSLSDMIEKIKPYIIPAVVIIAVIVGLSIVSKKGTARRA